MAARTRMFDDYRGDLMKKYTAEITSVLNHCKQGNYTDVCQLLTSHEADKSTLFKSMLLRAQVPSKLETFTDLDIQFHRVRFTSHQFLIDLAVMSLNTDLVQLVLDKGLYNLPDSPSMTPIHWLATLRNCAGDCRRTLRMLVQAGFNINATDAYGFTPLHLAYPGSFYLRHLATEDLHMIKLLIEEGADVNAQSKCGDTALLMSCQLGHQLPIAAAVDIIEYLLQAGADVNVNAKKTLFCLRIVLAKNELEILKCLLAYGLDLSVIKEEWLVGYLMTIPEQGRCDLIRLLLELGHKFDDHDAILNIAGPSLVKQQPVSLQRMCANRVRTCLAPELYSNLTKVSELPKYIKGYIMMK